MHDRCTDVNQFLACTTKWSRGDRSTTDCKHCSTKCTTALLLSFHILHQIFINLIFVLKIYDQGRSQKTIFMAIFPTWATPCPQFESLMLIKKYVLLCILGPEKFQPQMGQNCSDILISLQSKNLKERMESKLKISILVGDVGDWGV